MYKDVYIYIYICIVPLGFIKKNSNWKTDTFSSLKLVKRKPLSTEILNIS